MTQAKPQGLLASLGIHGLGHLEAVILAALADQRPLLLIGNHGTAKSALLNRLAAALGLAHRHYNASLISFDDLLGFPVPNEVRDGIDYLRTPDDLWSAESVFLDEISRCRPEVQNKLFSIIHERRVQGIELARLRYRWAAMNPPTGEQDPLDDPHAYLGSFPLDAALADRFAYILRVPDFDELDEAIRLRVIAQAEPETGTVAAIGQCVEAVRELLAEDPGDTWAARYVESACLSLAEAKLHLSGRRASALYHGQRAILAAGRILGRDDAAEDAALLSLRWGLPQRAQGQAIDEGLLQSVHRAAKRAAGTRTSRIYAQLRRERNPVRRIVSALRAKPALERLELSEVVTDAYASLPEAERFVLSRHLLPALSSEDRVTSTTLELIAGPSLDVARFSAEEIQQLQVRRTRMPQWNGVLECVSALDKGDPDDAALGNVLYALFARSDAAFDSQRLIALDKEWRALFRDVEASAS